MSEPQNAEQYWFQIDGGPPQGPMTLSVFRQGKDDSILERARYCSVGQSDWQLLAEHRELLTNAGVATPFEQPMSHPTILPVSVMDPSKSRAFSITRNQILSGLGIIIFFSLCGWLFYRLFANWNKENPSPRYACELFTQATAIESLKPTCNPDLCPALVTLYLLDINYSSQENDFVLTDETRVSPVEHWVRFRGTVIDASLGQRAPITGYFVVRKLNDNNPLSPDPWRISDVKFSTYSDKTFVTPFSLAQSHAEIAEQFRKKPSSGLGAVDFNKLWPAKVQPKESKTPIWPGLVSVISPLLRQKVNPPSK